MLELRITDKYDMVTRPMPPVARPSLTSRHSMQLRSSRPGTMFQATHFCTKLRMPKL